MLDYNTLNNLVEIFKKQGVRGVTLENGSTLEIKDGVLLINGVISNNKKYYKHVLHLTATGTSLTISLINDYSSKYTTVYAFLQRELSKIANKEDICSGSYTTSSSTCIFDCLVYPDRATTGGTWLVYGKYEGQTSGTTVTYSSSELTLQYESVIEI